MKIIKWILRLAVLFVVGGFLMPGTTHVERAIDINAPATTVFKQIIDLKNWSNWSAWHKLDPNTIYKFSEPSTVGTGAYYTWSSENRTVGKGKLTILDAKTNENVHCKMEFGNTEAISNFNLIAKDSTQTKVIWTLDSDNGLNPISRWMGLMMDKFVGPDYEKGLANMKAYCETNNK